MKKLINKIKKEKQSGQVTLIILLLLVVILTISLSLASRSIVDIRISQDEKEALRAFSAAEAGIEEALRDIQPFLIPNPSAVPVGDIYTNVKAVETGENSVRTVDKGDTTSFDLTGTGRGTLIVNWIDESQGDETIDKASIEIIIYANNSSFDRYAYNANGESRGNRFSAGGGGDPGYHSKASVSIRNNDVLARVRTFYNKATIKVHSNATNQLPAQQYDITSKAVAEGEKVGGIVVTKTIPILPAIFDYVLFSGRDLKNN